MASSNLLRANVMANPNLLGCGHLLVELAYFTFLKNLRNYLYLNLLQKVQLWQKGWRSWCLANPSLMFWAVGESRISERA